MAAGRPELVFVGGPQTGQRVVLAGGACMIGRSPEADIPAAEPYVSREHARFEYTYEGWVVEVLSGNGLRINDKKYKQGKRILLGTGDVIRLGLETDILFVAPDEDADAAIAAYEQDHPAPLVGQPTEAAPAPTPEPAESAPLGPPPAAAPAAEPEPELSPEEQALARAHRAKLKKYAIFGGVWLVVMIGVFAFLLSLKKTKPTEPASAGGPLTEEQIADAIRAAPERPRDLLQAGQRLAEARRLFRDRADRPGYRYVCYSDFKLYLAYAHATIFPEPDDRRQFKTVEKELLEEVQTTYQQALRFQRAANWSMADLALKKLLLLLPEESAENPVYTVILADVRERIKFVNAQMPKKKYRDRR